MAVGGKYIASAWVGLTLLRDEHQCMLPIEIWYLGDDDFPPHLRRLFERFNVTFVDASELPGPQPLRQMAGWELKPFAILHSQFAEVLWIDADNVPLRDPTYLFDDARYQQTGAVFWPDIRPANPYNPIWPICNLTPPAAPEWETGQIVLDKRRCWPALNLTLHFNNWSDFYYRYVLGDKETFHLAWRILDAPFSMPDLAPLRASAGFDNSDSDPSVVFALWQHDLRGRPIFLHRTGAKWVPYGQNVLCDGFEHHDRCLSALDELRGLWDGYLQQSPAPDAGTLPCGRSFLYIRRGLDSRPLRLLPNGRVGRGARIAECFWREETIDGVRSLVLSSRSVDTCRLQLQSDSVWHGAWLQFEQIPVEIIPIDSADEPGSNLPRRLLYITPVAPADGGNGLAMRAASVLKILTEHYRVSVLIIPRYSSAAASDLPDWLSARCENVRWAAPPVSYSELDTHNPAQISAWTEAAGRAYATEEFDIVHVFRMATLECSERYLSRTLDRAVEWHLDIDDVESRTLERLHALNQRRAGVAATQAEMRQRDGLAATERQILRTWDRVYVCSPADREYLAGQVAERRAGIVVLPNSVNVPDDPESAPRAAPITMLFVGTYGYLPNDDAAVWFCREILPVIREMTPLPVRVMLAGSGVSAEVESLGHIPEVDIIGPVARIDDCYRQADIVIVPLRAGGGTRIKILEALAHRRPVVSTSLGAEGLDLVNEREILIADRAHYFARQCLRLIGDARLAGRISENGRERVKRDYRPDAVAERVIREIEPLQRLEQ